MFNDHFEDMPDPLDDFLAQLLSDLPDFLPNPINAPPPSSASGPTPTSHHTADPHLTCQWVSTYDPLLICGATVSSDPKHACTHFRQFHDVRGNEKVIVSCHWRDCQVPPMQRGSMIRHVLSVHLGLLKWRCGACGRMFSRKGTGHACAGSEEG